MDITQRRGRVVARPVPDTNIARIAGIRQSDN
jgi:hypothetical protein